MNLTNYKQTQRLKAKRCSSLIKRITMIILLYLSTLSFFMCNTMEPPDKGPAKPKNFYFSIQNWTIYNTSNSGLPGNSLRTIAIDEKNHVWAGTFYNGVAEFDGSKWTVYNTQNSGLPNDSILAITADQKGIIWIGTHNGLARFDGKNWTVFNPSNTPMEYRIVSSLTVDQNNTLWVDCGHATAGGFLSYDGKTWHSYTRENSPLPCSIVNKIHVDKDNNKWIGTGIFQGKGGLIKIDRFNNWQVYTKENSGMLYNSADALASDLNGNFWIGYRVPYLLDPGYYHGGLQMLRGDKWNDFSPNSGGKYNESAVASNRVEELLCDKDGYLWVATETEGKFNYNLSLFKDGLWKSIEDAFNEYPHPTIREMVIDKDNKLWLATQLGVIAFDYQVITQ